MKYERFAVIVAVAAVVLLGSPLWAQEGEEQWDWRDVELENVLTGETFRISDFAGKPILLETFAVWCPTCKRQQEQIQALHASVGDDVISISLDVDPNESAELVRDHADSNGFDWNYAISPVELTRALMAEFGTTIVASPSAPVVLICADQTHARLLGRGVKRVAKLLDEIDEGCEI